MKTNVSINRKNIAITLSLIIIGIMAETNEHLPVLSFPKIEIPYLAAVIEIPYLGIGITICAVVIAAWLVFSLVGICGYVGRM